jgi:hypothetical protein
VLPQDVHVKQIDLRGTDIETRTSIRWSDAELLKRDPYCSGFSGVVCSRRELQDRCPGSPGGWINYKSRVALRSKALALQLGVGRLVNWSYLRKSSMQIWAREALTSDPAVLKVISIGFEGIMGVK